MTYELIPQPSAGYAEVRIDGVLCAKIDMLLLRTLRHVAADPLHLSVIPFLEAVSRPGKDV